jgi:endonuclease-8
MVRLAHTMLEQNRHQPQICTTGDKRRGRSLWIYGRRGERCLRCGTPVESAELGEPPKARLAYWCPSCQPLRG